MKLIDLLVQELPKRGGWPVGAKALAQDIGGRVYGYACNEVRQSGGMWLSKSGNDMLGLWHVDVTMAEDWTESYIIREQYEAALAESQQPAWNGEGLPPVGTECEWLASGDHDWMRVKVLAYHEDEVWLQPLNGAQSFTVGNPDDFRPMRTEAERKRDKFLSYCNGKPVNTYAELYDDIAAGKIPGVKLEADHE